MSFLLILELFVIKLDSQEDLNQLVDFYDSWIDGSC